MDLAAAFLALAGLGAVVMTVMRIKGREIPTVLLGTMYGAVAAAGVISIADALHGQGVPPVTLIALVLFMAAAVGGAFLFVFFPLKDKRLPSPLTFVHAAAAGIALIMFLVSIFGATNTPPADAGSPHLPAKEQAEPQQLFQ